MAVTAEFRTRVALEALESATVCKRPPRGTSVMRTR